MKLWPVSLFFLVAYLPFQAALNLTPDVDLMSGRILILGLFFFWLLKQLSQAPKELFSSVAGRPALWLAAFFSLAALSVLAAANPAWGLRKLLVFASIFPLFCLVRFLLKNIKERAVLIYVVIGGATLSAMLALAQFSSQFVFGLDPLMSFWAARVVPIFSGASQAALVVSNPSWLVDAGGQTLMRAIGLFPDPHMLAFYLGLAFPFALAILFFEKRYRFIFFLISCLLVLVLLLTFSRGGYLGLAASLAVFGALAWRRLSGLAKKFLAASVLLAAVILLLIGWPVASRLFSSFNLSEGSNLGRLAIWQASWAVMKTSPIVGVGLGNYPVAADFSGAYRSAVTSHNLYMDLWAETGIFGLAAWLGLIASAAAAAYRRLAKEPVVALGVLAGLAYFSVHAFFETSIFNPTVLAFLMIILGLAASKDKEDVL